MTVGSLPLLPFLRILQWPEGDDWITAVGTVPIEELIVTVRSTRLASDDEWDDLIQLSYEERDGFDPEFTPVGSGATSTMERWIVTMSESAHYLLVQSESFSETIYVEPDPLRPIVTYRTLDTLFVVALVDLADLPAADGQVLVVTLADGTVLKADLIEAGNENGRVQRSCSMTPRVRQSRPRCTTGLGRSPASDASGRSADEVDAERSAPARRRSSGANRRRC